MYSHPCYVHTSEGPKPKSLIDIYRIVAIPSHSYTYAFIVRIHSTVSSLSREFIQRFPLEPASQHATLLDGMHASYPCSDLLLLADTGADVRSRLTCSSAFREMPGWRANQRGWTDMYAKCTHQSPLGGGMLAPTAGRAKGTMAAGALLLCAASVCVMVCVGGTGGNLFCEPSILHVGHRGCGSSSRGVGPMTIGSRPAASQS